MKKITGLIVGVVLLLVFAGDALATTYTHYRPMKAVLPEAVSTSITVNKVTTVNGVAHFDLWTDELLSFGAVSYNSTYGYWAPAYSFALDISPVAADGTPAAGRPQVTVKFTAFNKPLFATHGLDYKGVLTFVAVTGGPNPEDQTENILLGGVGKRFGAVVTDTIISPNQLMGGFLRLYAGIYTGSPVIQGAETFSSANISGTYSATLLITAVIQ